MFSDKYPRLVSWGNIQEGRIEVSGTIPEVLGRPVRICEEKHGADDEFSLNITE